MSSSEPENDHAIYGTVDPFSGQLLLALEGPRVLLHFNSTQDLRGIGCRTKAEANELEDYFASPGKPRSRSRGLSTRYSTKSVKDWEEQVKAGESEPIDPKNPSEPEDGDAGQAPAWFPSRANHLIY